MFFSFFSQLLIFNLFSSCDYGFSFAFLLPSQGIARYSIRIIAQMQMFFMLILS